MVEGVAFEKKKKAKACHLGFGQGREAEQQALQVGSNPGGGTFHLVSDDRDPDPAQFFDSLLSL
jgi:hypothetical protein